MRDIREGPISIVVKQDVVSPEAAKQIIPAIVVVIADANAGLPARAGEAGFCSDIGEGSVAIVFEEMRSRRSSGRPVSIEARSVRQIDIDPTIVIVIKESKSASLGFDDVALAIY